MNAPPRNVVPLASIACILSGLVALLVIHWYSYFVFRTTFLGYSIPMLSRSLGEWTNFSQFLIPIYVLLALGFALGVHARQTRTGKVCVSVAVVLAFVEVALRTALFFPAPVTY